jgi:hypothetical protein
MVYSQTKNPNFGVYSKASGWNIFGICYSHLVSLRLFGVFYGNLVNFVVVWNKFFYFGM